MHKQALGSGETDRCFARTTNGAGGAFKDATYANPFIGPTRKRQTHVDSVVAVICALLMVGLFFLL